MASAPELSASTLVEVMTAMAGMPMPMTVRDCPLLVLPDRAARGEAARSGGCAPWGVGRFRYPRGSRAATRRGVVAAPPGMTTIAP